jgi:hypothetical protein
MALKELFQTQLDLLEPAAEIAVFSQIRLSL